MNAQSAGSISWRQLADAFVARRKLWIAPTIACAVLAAFYSLVAPRYWQASQSLVIRQEAAGASPRPGKFADLYEMRTLQETILELAKSQQVIVATLAAVDLRELGADAVAPDAEDVEQLRKHLKMLPPEGGEFGKTEVFYLCVEDTDRDRAIRLVSELCVQLDEGLRGLRAKRAQSLINELEQQVAVATDVQTRETARLAEFESGVGPDLGELRVLHSAQSGQSDLRMEVVQVESDVRKFQTQLREGEQLLALLRAAEQDPQTLVATPNSLLSSQLALRRLKDGLVDAQLATARLAGTRSSDHPRVRAAVEAEEQVRNDLHRELVTAIRGAEVEIELSRQRLAATRDRLATLQTRLSKLAELRAGYSNRVAAVDNSRVALDHARESLSAARAALAAAHSGSLVTQLDRPETGPYPVGLGRTTTTAAGAMAGLMLGMGLVFLSVAPRPYGRRASDRTAAVVAAGPPQASAAAPAAEAPIRPRRASDVAPAVALAAAPAQPARPASVRPSTPAAAAPVRPVAASAPTIVAPVAAEVGGYAGLSLQEALLAAQRLQT